MAITVLKSYAGNFPSATSITMNGVTGQPAGSLILAFLTRSSAGTGPSTANRAGWALVSSESTGTERTEVWSKVAESTDAGVTFTWGTASPFLISYVVLSNAALAYTRWGSGTDSGTVTAPSISLNAEDGLFVYATSVHENVGVGYYRTPAEMTSITSTSESTSPGTIGGMFFQSVGATGYTGTRSLSVFSGASAATEWGAVSIALDNTETASEPTPEPAEAETHRRYYDVAPVVAAIDSATTVAELDAALSPMEAVYGTMIVNKMEAGQPFGGGIFAYDGQEFADPNLKASLRALVDELAKYPPAFIQSSMLTDINLVKNLRNGDTGESIGGVASGGGLYMNTNRITEATVPDKTDLLRWFRPLFHHELHHIFRASWSTEFADLEAQWVTHNPDGFSYTGMASIDPDGTARPTGFVRDYSRHSYLEDLADAWSALMATELYDTVQGYLAADTGLAGKVQMTRDWAAAKSPEMAAADFYSTLHAASAGYDRVVNPWGQALIQAFGSGAWSKVSGPAVAFTANGTDLVLDPAPSFAEQTFVFDYGGDQTTVTVAPATWGVKQGGAVVPVRLTTK